MLTQRGKMVEDHHSTFFGKIAAYFTHHVPLINIQQDATLVQTAQVESKQPKVIITVTQIQGKVPVTILHPCGALNAGSYLELIATAKQAYQDGARHILLDMSDIPSLGISGMVALHNIAVFLRGGELPDPEAGWETFRTVGRDLKAGGLQKHFKLLNPRPDVKQALSQAGFDSFLEIYTDQETAMASF